MSVTPLQPPPDLTDLALFDAAINRIEAHIASAFTARGWTPDPVKLHEAALVHLASGDDAGKTERMRQLRRFEYVRYLIATGRVSDRDTTAQEAPRR